VAALKRIGSTEQATQGRRNGDPRKIQLALELRSKSIVAATWLLQHTNKAEVPMTQNKPNWDIQSL
jgi:hypothetical protein